VDELIWIDDWQIQCCGDAFEVGSQVSWTVRDPDSEGLIDALGPDVASGLTGAEDHHAADPATLREVNGKVTSIRAAYCMFASRAGTERSYRRPVEGTRHLVKRRRADGWEPDGRDLDPPTNFVGYVVKLETS
jgi:hypothetical protein